MTTLSLKPGLLATSGVAALYVFAAPLASAQAPADASDVVVISGTKTNDFGEKSGIPLEKMPQSVQVLDDTDLIESGVRTIEDALRAVPSATVARSRVGTFASGTLRIRGFAADQMRNGIRQHYYEDVDPSAMSNIARIEVLKGPSGVLYGQSGVGGIVSIITKQPTDTFEGSIALTGGDYGQAMVTADIGGPITDTLGYRLTGEVERSGTFVDFQDYDRENVGLALTWRPNDWVSAHFVAEYIHRLTLSNPGLPTVGTVVSNGAATVDRSTFLGEPDFAYQENHSPLIQAWADFKLNDTWTLTPRFQYSQFNNRSQSVILQAPVTGQPTVIQRTGRNAGEKDRFWLGQVDLSGEANAFGVDHKLLFGVEYSVDHVNFRMNGNVDCGIGSIDALNPVYGCGAPTTNFAFFAPNFLEGYAAYAQDQIALTDAWNLVAGVRHSQFDNDTQFITAFFGSAASADLSNTTWQLGTTYALGGGVSLFGGYNTGFDLEWVTGARRADGSPFKPETSDQIEAGVRFVRDDLNASISAFRVHRNDVGIPDPTNIGFQLQEGQFRVQGIELEGAWSPALGWWLQGGYAYLDGEVTKTTTPGLLGAELAETPENTATASARVELGALQLRAAANYVGSRKMVNGGAVTLPDYTVFDLGLGTDLGPFRLDATLSNVTDETYYYSDNLSVFSVGGEDHVFPGEPRNFSVRLAYKFGGEQR